MDAGFSSGSEAGDDAGSILAGSAFTVGNRVGKRGRSPISVSQSSAPASTPNSKQRRTDDADDLLDSGRHAVPLSALADQRGAIGIHTYILTFMRQG